jgi:transcriptional regulator
MYVPAHFRETRTAAMHAFIREHSFATLVSRLDGELFASHLPLLLDTDRGPWGTLLGHMARANRHWNAFVGATATDEASLVMFQGPHAYISPAWYATAPAVPTWNYVAVHAYGEPVVVSDPSRVSDIVEATVRTFESGMRKPWTTDGLSVEYVERMLKGVVAFEIPITRLEGKRKLGQNRSEADMRGAAAGLRQHSRDPGALPLADLMDEAATALTVRNGT